MRNQSIAFLSLVFLAFQASAQVTTAFTYQGELEQSGNPATGEFDFEFELFDASTGGLSMAGPVNVEDIFVDGGLFATEVDFGPNVFGMMDVWLEIRVRQGDSTGGFTTLSPRQKVTPTPIARHALNVEMDAIDTTSIAPGAVTTDDIADGAVTQTVLAGSSVGSIEVIDDSLAAGDIAANAVGSSEIAAGAVGTSELAAGSVTAGTLANPYETGTVDLETIAASSFFNTRQVERSVGFSTSFPGQPVVTATLQSQFGGASELLGPLLLSNVSPTGFDLSFAHRTIPVSVSRKRNIAIAPLAEVNARPAIAYDSIGSLEYVRALDSNGLQWGNPVTVATESVDKIEMLIVDGRPAVAYNTGDGRLLYARANDADGTSWPAPVTIFSAGFGINDFSLAMIGSVPAVAARNDTDDIGYLAADDSTGSAWNSSAAVLVVNNSNEGLSLTEVSGNPAISYPWDNGEASNSTTFMSEVRYVRAGDASGSSWGSIVSVQSFGTFDRPVDTGLHVVDGNPSIFYVLSEGGTTFRRAPFFARATDGTGTAWGSPVDVFPPATAANGDIQSTLIAGNPTLVWQERGDFELNFSQSTNGGASFFTVTIVNLLLTGSSSSASVGASLAEINGEIAFAYTRSDIRELRYIRNGNPAAGTFISWIAVSP